ncbi:MAG: lipoyl(octanoyl) transferase LipB [Candidatus Caldarchaeum sp.]|nr:lipoyl(octanoyl) transferase LipB [Candidatus Caldarchaeum sp.]
MSPNEIIFIDLGTVEYGLCHRLMLKLLEERVANEIGDTVLLLEHQDVYTLGRRGRDENIFDRSIPVYKVERGGDATYHGPGQLVVYPIVSLAELKLGVAEFVNLLEEATIRTLADFSISAGRVEGKPGVWVTQRKIASIGLAVKNWVTYHGLALNVNTDLSKFDGIRPCGMESHVMTSMARIKGESLNISDVKKSLIVHFSSLLGKKPAYLKKTAEEVLETAKVI